MMPMFGLPAYVVSACKKGLKYHDAGFSGDGLRPETVRQAKKAVSDGQWDDQKIIKASAWFARHESDLVSGSFDKDKPKPGGVAWLLWGSDPATGDKGRDWIDKKAEKIKGQRSESSYAESDPSTPAPPEDRIKGSEKNEPGSAGSTGTGIELSEQVIRTLRAKVKEHNEENTDPGQRATLGTLKKVYRRGAGAYSTSHRPNVSRAAWAMARVNAFLHLLAKGKPKNSAYITDNDLLPEEHPMSKDKETAREFASSAGDTMTGTTRSFSMDTEESYAEFRDGDIHVMRLGPLFDIESGEKILDLDPELAQTIATTTQAVIESGHTVPMSLEHGIETGYRGEPGSDRRPYGQVTRVYYIHEDDESGKPAGIYASKEWTALGAEFVAAAKMQDGRTALRVSPRVKFSPAYHPRSGEELGSSWFDVLAVTTLPRQDSLEPLEMSREQSVEGDSEKGFPTQERFGKIESKEPRATGSMPGNETAHPMAQNETDGNMTEKKKTGGDEPIALLHRDSVESRALFRAAGLEGESIDELTELFNRQTAELQELRVEVAEAREDKERREQLARDAAVDAILADHDFDTEEERGFFRSALLSPDEAIRTQAEAALSGRKKEDELAGVDAAILEAKEAGSIPADFDADAVRELARGGNANIAIGIIKAIPGATVVRTGDPAGSDVAVEATEPSRDEAAAMLSKLAREKMKADGGTLSNALRLVKTERADLVAISERVK